MLKQNRVSFSDNLTISGQCVQKEEESSCQVFSICLAFRGTPALVIKQTYFLHLYLFIRRHFKCLRNYCFYMEWIINTAFVFTLIFNGLLTLST